MVQVADETQRCLAVGYFRRLYPSLRLMKSLLDRGYLGPVRRFHAEGGGRYSWAAATLANMQRDLAGGGALIDFGSHLLDALFYLFDEPFEVIGYQDNSLGGVEADCIVEARLTHGARTVDGRIEVARTRDLGNFVRVECDEGDLVFELNERFRIRVMPRNAETLDSFDGPLARIFARSTMASAAGRRVLVRDVPAADRRLAGIDQGRPRAAAVGPLRRGDLPHDRRLLCTPDADGRAVGRGRIRAEAGTNPCRRRPEWQARAAHRRHRVHRQSSGRDPRAAGWLAGARGHSQSRQCQSPGSAAGGADSGRLAGRGDAPRADGRLRRGRPLRGWHRVGTAPGDFQGHRGRHAKAGRGGARRRRQAFRAPEHHLRVWRRWRDDRDDRRDDAGEAGVGQRVPEKARPRRSEVVQDLVRRGLSAVIFRPARVFGPFSRIFIERPLAAIAEGRFRWLGDPHVPADMVYVDSVVHGIVLALDADKDRVSGEVFTMGDADPITWYDFYDYFAKAMNVDLATVPAITSNGGEPANRQGLVGGIRSILKSPEFKKFGRKILDTDPIGTLPRANARKSPRDGTLPAPFRRR